MTHEGVDGAAGPGRLGSRGGGAGAAGRARERARPGPGGRRVRDRPGDRVGQVRVGPAGQGPARPRARVARPGDRGPGRQRVQSGRPGGRDRSPAGPGPVPELRRRRVGHVPQRQVHRARHQGGGRVLLGALAGPPAPCGQGGRAPGPPGRPDGTGQRAGQGVGAHRADRPAGRLAAQDGARHRGRADRAVGGDHGPAAGAGSPRPRPGDGRAQAAARQGPRGPLPHRAGQGPGRGRRRHHRVYRGRGSCSSMCSSTTRPGA